ncbi:MAG: MBL fold metallo-hydrolase [Clostridia bacterium]|nr:MBL fold metallo-hydrolase [Clostridia bacterium]
MARQTFVTTMPNRTGAFLAAARVFHREGVNMVRVSYNKAVDLHTLFIDGEGEPGALQRVRASLSEMGYLTRQLPEIGVVPIEIDIPDHEGALLPVLEILARYDINISYLNSTQTGESCQHFLMGLLIEKPALIASLLSEVNALYPVRIAGEAGGCPDNSVFYLDLAARVEKTLHLSQEKLLEFLSEANRTMQLLQRTNENPATVFGQIERFMDYVAGHQGKNFRCQVSRKRLTDQVELAVIEPVCGSNTYLLRAGNTLVMLDSGYALYEKEMQGIFRRLYPDWEGLEKHFYISHADVDHCGLLRALEGEGTVHLNPLSYESLRRQGLGVEDNRETRMFCFGYSRLSRLISGYEPPLLERVEIYGQGAPREHEELLRIGEMPIGDLTFQIWEGSGGHLAGEQIYVEPAQGILFTGDNFLDFKGFSKELQDFNAIAPYLMRSVNVDSRKASLMRRAVGDMAARIAAQLGRPALILGGHGSPAGYDGEGFKRAEGFEQIG